MSKVILFSFTAAANPTLVAATTVMLLLPKANKLMLGYLIGALFTSVTLGIVIVSGAENSGVVSSGTTTINPVIDLAFGSIILALGLLIRAGRDKPLRDRRAERKREKHKEEKTPRWQRVLRRGDPKVTVVVGALLTLPGASYLAALTSIAKLHYSDVGNVLLVLLVNVIMLALLEVPLISFAVAPEWTPNAIERVKAWFAREGRKVLVIGLLALGSLLILRGVIELIAA
jgi:hypothetical protein